MNIDKMEGFELRKLLFDAGCAPKQFECRGDRITEKPSLFMDDEDWVPDINPTQAIEMAKSNGFSGEIVWDDEPPSVAWIIMPHPEDSVRATGKTEALALSRAVAKAIQVRRRDE